MVSAQSHIKCTQSHFTRIDMANIDICEHVSIINMLKLATFAFIGATDLESVLLHLALYTEHYGPSFVAKFQIFVKQGAFAVVHKEI